MNDSDSIDELHPRLKQTLVQHDNLIDELDPRAGGRSHPVSYTHLTLPTIAGV